MERSWEVADVFRAFGQAYRDVHRLPKRHLRAMRAIEVCRTAELGGHVDECDQCGGIRISYNSCRNRHCPKCQSLDKERWLEARKREVLPVRYFHVVFTVPKKLRPVALRNQRVFYNLLFQAVSGTLKELCRDRKHLGAEIGFIAVLHTWTRTLLDHPHIHCIVPAGGLALDGKRWMKGRKKFFIPFKVLSRKFRGKLLDYLKKAYESGSLELVGKIEPLRDREQWRRLVDALYRQEWVVYTKASMNAPEDVIEYLGRYTHRVALTNDRIVRWDGETATIRYRDSRDSNKVRFLNLESFEFIRRFLLHVLPEGFMKIRYYGILSNRNRGTKLVRVMEFLLMRGSFDAGRKERWEELLLRLTGLDPRICPHCGKGRMVFKEILYPKLSRASP
jgi:hypothetical protein